MGSTLVGTACPPVLLTASDGDTRTDPLHTRTMCAALQHASTLDTDVPLDVAEHAVAVLGELLSNTARHAHATRVEVSLKATADEVRLTVSDNGGGIPEQSRRSGLDNLAERARQVGGALELSTPDGGGTRLVWRAPLT